MGRGANGIPHSATIPVWGMSWDTIGQHGAHHAVPHGKYHGVHDGMFHDLHHGNICPMGSSMGRPMAYPTEVLTGHSKMAPVGWPMEGHHICHVTSIGQGIIRGLSRAISNR